MPLAERSRLFRATALSALNSLFGAEESRLLGQVRPVDVKGWREQASDTSRYSVWVAQH